MVPPMAFIPTFREAVSAFETCSYSASMNRAQVRPSFQRDPMPARSMNSNPEPITRWPELAGEWMKARGWLKWN